MSDDDISYADMIALDTIHNTNWPIPRTKLAADLGLAAVIADLELRGYIETNPAGYLLLTPRGHDLYQPFEATA